MERCEACGEPPTSRNPLNNHHYKGRKHYPHDIIRCHQFTCHTLLQYLTNLFIQEGLEYRLTKEYMVNFYRKVRKVRLE